jgi:hypothetical protein
MDTARRTVELVEHPVREKRDVFVAVYFALHDAVPSVFAGTLLHRLGCKCNRFYCMTISVIDTRVYPCFLVCTKCIGVHRCTGAEMGKTAVFCITVCISRRDAH